MTNPFNALVGGPVQQKSSNPFDDIVTQNGLVVGQAPQDDNEEMGFFHWGKNVVVNTAKMLAQGPSQYPGQTLSNAFDTAVNDFQNWFSRSHSFTMDDAKEAGMGLLTLPFSPSKWGQVAKSLADLPISFLEASTGQNLASDTYTPLSPEQRSERMKSATGGLIAAAVTAGASRGLNAIEASVFTPKSVKLLNPKTIGSAASTAELAMAKPALGPLAREFIKGSVEAGIAGSTYTLVARAGEEDIVVSTISNGLIFAPLGGAFKLVSTAKGMMKGELPSIEQNIQNARDISYIRGLQFSEDATFLGVANNIENLATGSSLAQAYIKGRLDTDPGKSHIFPNISKDELPDVMKLVQGKTDNFAVHLGDDGSYSILFGGKNDISKTKAMFEQTGHAEGRIVSYDGVDYRVTKVNPKSLVIVPLVNSDGTFNPIDNVTGKKNVRLSDVKLKSNSVFDIDTVSPAEYTSKVFASWASEVIKLSSNKASKIEDAVFTDPVSYRGVLAKVARGMGFDDGDLPALSQKIENKLGEYLKGTLTDEDREWIGKAQKNLNDYQVKVKEDFVNGLHDKAEFLNEQAWGNGLFVDTEQAGVLNIRSSEDGRSIGKAKTLDEALDYVRKSGQAETYSYGDDLKALPTKIAAPLGMPQYKEGWNPGKRNKYLGSLTDQLRARMSLIFNVGDQVKGIDNIFGTNLYKDVFYPTQEVITRFYAANHNLENSFLTSADKKLAKFSPDRKRVINSWTQINSPDDMVISGVRKGIPLAPELQEIGQWLHNNSIDLGKVYEARRMMKNALEGAEQAGILSKLSEKEQLALKTFDNISKKGTDEIPLMETLHYSQSLQNGLGAKEAFAKLSGMSAEEIKVGHEILGQYDLIAKHFGITDYQTLNVMIDHYRNFIKNRKSDWFNQILKGTGNDNTPDFVAELAKLGMIDSYVDNPIDALRNYVKVGNKVSILNPVLAQARESLNNVNKGFQGISDDIGAKDQKVNFKAPYERILSYIAELEGIPDSSSQFTKAALKAGEKVFNFEAGKEGFDKLTRYITGTIELATQGLRPSQGIRDFYSAMGNHNIRYGFKAGKDWVRWFKDDKLSDALLKQGDIIGLDINQFLSAGGLFEQGQAGKAFEKSLKVGFAGTLQKPVHVRAQAATFMERFKVAEEVLGELSRNKITKEKAYKKLLLGDAYDPAVAQAFDAKVSSGKFFEAARMYAQESARETIGQYGAAYHPYKWNTSTGRLMGQFGQWSSMQLGFLTRLSGQGSLGYRYAALSRWAAVNGALYTIEKSLGLNLSSWYMTPANMNFSGSPIVQVATAALSSSSASDYERKQGTQVLNKLIPFQDEKSIAQVYLPFSYATRDIVRAADDFARGFYLQAPLQAIGIPTDQGERSMIDLALGNRARLDR